MNARTQPLTYDSDAMFATGLLKLLRTRSNELNSASLELLVRIGCAKAVPGQEANDAIKELFSLHPEFARHAPRHMLALVDLPLWVWARETVEPKESETFERFARRWKTLIDNDSATRPHLLGARALNMTYALLDEMTKNDALQASVHWQDDSIYAGWRNVYTEDAGPMLRWQESSLRLGLLHEAVQALGAQEDKALRKVPLPLRWASRLKDELEDMTFEQQIECLTFWFNSNLSATYKIRAAKGASPQVWLNPAVHAFLGNILPKTEGTRWPTLPWVEHENARPRIKQDAAAQCNRDLMLLYCPNLALVVDAVAPAQLWTERKSMVQLVTACSKKTSDVENLNDMGDLFAPPP